MNWSRSPRDAFWVQRINPVTECVELARIASGRSRVEGGRVTRARHAT